MRQETAVERVDRRQGGTAGGRRRTDAGKSGKQRLAAGIAQELVTTPAPAHYLDRHTPGIFAKWWAGMVATAPEMVCSGIK